MDRSDPDDSSAPGKPTNQDPYVDRMRPDPSSPAKKALTLAGLLGRSERPGYQRVYFSDALNHYAEIRSDDIIHTESIPPEMAPFPGLHATRLMVDRNARIDYVRSTGPDELSDFDLDIRGGPTAVYGVRTLDITDPFSVCETCQTCQTCNTCQTCRTCAGHTCDGGTCQGNTCQTCYDNTCTYVNTCQNTCNQYTCRTCNTQCGQNTCAPTCQTCNTNCGQGTCVATYCATHCHTWCEPGCPSWTEAPQYCEHRTYQNTMCPHVPACTG
jgi:hypothetical protein